MERTIEERAKSHAGVSTNPRAIYNEVYVLATRYASYKEGATEQKDIDEDHFREVKKMIIEKACKWLMKYFVFENEGMTASGCDVFLRKFRKAMEE